MKKPVVLILSLVGIMVLVSCSMNKQADYPAAIMVNETIYLLPAAPMTEEVDERAAAVSRRTGKHDRQVS